MTAGYAGQGAAAPAVTESGVQEDEGSVAVVEDCDGTANLKLLIKYNGRHLNTSGVLA